MSSHPDVSIIIPCHNAEPWLAACLESVLEPEGYTQEVIVVDDGSTDASRLVAERHVPRGIRLLSQQRTSPGAARNRGFSESRGAWVQFLDADDLIGPGKISRQLSVLRESPPGTVASCGWSRFYGEFCPGTAHPAEPATARDYLPAWLFLRTQAAEGCMMHPAAWLTPRDLVQRAGPWDQSLTPNDDGEFFARVLALASGIRFVDGVHTHYRSGLSGSMSVARSRSRMEAMHRSALRFSETLLGCDQSRETLSAVSEMWERLRYELYPEAPSLSRDAARRAREDGHEPRTRLPCGPRLKWLRAIGAWKLARRLQVRFR
ncbi:MAG: glycosyltransferase family 2 protein [Opitutaceae bacterium]|nr:glycosyltransferase family 2 protein [Opitutaceae bacterium]